MTSLLLQNRRLFVLVLLLLFVGGGAAFLTMPSEEDPRITNRTAVIFTALPGASAERVEQLVTERIEDAIEELDDIKEIKSSSTTGLSAVSVTLEDFINDTDGPFGRIRDAVDDARPLLPADAQAPIFDDDRAGAYTMLVALTWTLESPPNLTVMRRSALELQDRLRSLPGTELVTLHGASQEEVVVSVDASTTAALGVTTAQIAGAISGADAKVSAGAFEGDRFAFGLELRGEIDSLTRLRAIPIATNADGAVIRVGDVAEVRRSLVDPATDLAFHGDERAIIIAARLQENLQVTAWADRAKVEVAEFQQDLSYGLQSDIIFNQGDYAAERFNSLANNLLLGAAIVIALLLITLGWRAALLVAAAIPLTGLAAVMGLNVLNVSINQISVTGLVVALGLLVDAAIVMTDALRRRLLEGLSPREALDTSVKRLFMPLLASTLTTVLAFLPLATFPGPTGEFVSGIGKSVIASLSSSFLLAVTVIATLAAAILSKTLKRQSGKRPPFWVAGIDPGPFGRLFRGSLSISLKAPLLSMVLAITLPVLGFLSVPNLPLSFFPPADRNQFNLELTLPTHTTVAETARVVARAHAKLNEMPDVEAVTWFVGRSAPSFYYNLPQNRDGNTFYAQAMVTTTSLRNIERTVNAVQTQLSQTIPQAQIIARELSQGPPTFAPIELRIYGRDLDTLQAISEQARLVLSQTPNVVATRATYAGGEPKLWVEVDEERVRQSGYAVTELAGLLRSELDGAVGGSLVEGSEELPIRLWTGSEQRRSLGELASIDFETASGLNVPLLSLGELNLEATPATLRRFDGERVNIVSGYVRAGALPSTAIGAFETAWAESGYTLPAGYRLSFGGEAEARSDSVNNLVGQIGLIVVFTIGVIVLTFNSFRLAAIVLVVAGLSAGSGFLALATFGFSFGFVSIIAIVGLIGVAINAAIIILSGLNLNASALAGEHSAIVDETLAASRHIWSTTLTTVGGFTPLILSDSRFWPPFAITIAGGVLISTLISFYFVPQSFLLVRRRTQKP